MKTYLFYICFILACLCSAKIAAFDFSLTRSGILFDGEPEYNQNGAYFSFDGADFNMAFIKRNDGGFNAFVFMSNDGVFDILWNGEKKANNLKIKPLENGVDFEYKIDMNAAAGSGADYGRITLKLSRPENYDALNYAAGFYYDYFEFLNTGMELSGTAKDGGTDFSVQPIYHFRYGDIFSLRFGINLAGMFIGDIGRMVYFDMSIKYKW